MTRLTASEFRTRDLHNGPYLALVIAVAAGVLYSVVQPQHWLRGVGVVGVSLAVAAGLRALLTDRQAGLLAVRRRPFDVCCYLVLAVGILGVAVVLPR